MMNGTISVVKNAMRILKMCESLNYKIVEYLKKMSSQDNLSTAFPFFWVIRDVKYLPTDADYHWNKVIYLNEESGEEISQDEWDALPTERNNDCEQIQDDFREVYLMKTYEESGMFLTHEDAKNHLSKNYYHYSEEAHPYLKHAWRAPLMEEFFDNLFQYFNVKIPPEMYHENKERDKNMKNLQLKIINHYGLEKQKNKLKEEMTELAYARDKNNFIEEMADVLNVMQGIIAHLNCGDKIKQIQLKKLQRQEQQIEEENKAKFGGVNQ